MTENFEIIYAEKMDDEYQSIIIEAFNKDAREKKGLTGDLKTFSFSCLNQHKSFVAGVSGVSFWGALYVSSLFVNENYRNQKYGSLLIKKLKI